MDVGEALFKIRKDKRMTLKEAAGEVVSLSHLSRVEKGENKLSADEFFLILNNLNTTIDEFHFIKGNERESRQRMWLNEIVEAMNQKDIERIKKVEKELREQSFAPYSFEQFILIGIDNVYRGLNQEEFDGSFFLDYLMQVENWGKVELNIFTIFSITLPTEALWHLMETAIKKCQYYVSLRGHELMISHLFHNLFQVFYSRNEISYAEHILQKMRKEYLDKIDSIQAFVNWEINEALLAYQKGKIKQVIKGYENAIFLCEQTGKKDQVRKFQKDLEKYKNGEDPIAQKEIVLEVEWF